MSLRDFVRGARGAAFRRATAGSVAPLFGLSVLMVIGAVGLAIDSARGYGAKSQLQNAMDAAALATARRLSEDPSIDVATVFSTFFETSRPQANWITVSAVDVQRSGNTVSANVDATMPALFMQLFGQGTMELAAHASAEFGIGDLELVLALDNTSSMAGTKIATLKTAAQNLVDSLARVTPTPEKLRIGLVPFSQYVNVGLANRNQSWIDVPLDYSETVNSCGNTYPNATYSNCRTINTTCTTDGISSPCSYETCDVDYGTPVYSCSTSTINHTWQGCVRARAYPLNLTDGSYSTRIPGQVDVSCAAPIQPLTSDRSVIRDAITAMNPYGDTFIPEGLMWGWRTLSPAAPFDQSQAGGATRVARYLVLMTDGVNSVSPTPTGHNGNDTALANRYTQEACTAIKSDNITIFTVAFEVTDTGIKDILRSCASADGFFYDAADSSQLVAAFDAVGQQLVNLRLTK